MLLENGRFVFSSNGLEKWKSAPLRSAFREAQLLSGAREFYAPFKLSYVAGTVLTANSSFITNSCNSSLDFTNSLYYDEWSLAEWMVPEVLRNEPSNENVVLWLPCLVVLLIGALYFATALGWNESDASCGCCQFPALLPTCLVIPDDMEPAITDIIKQCWQT
ncbi:hypothetical protein Ahy_B05g075401 [Arachis hypogaea]|uniref:Uncharacterized protein n=1 Tax=Arachis hypogaea TaxID=3818 RepID=A0A444Z164_ARAHY|nr:hypothetical protein Ahy_B05g075401 [Arachis hypogaea]